MYLQFSKHLTYRNIKKKKEMNQHSTTQLNYFYIKCTAKWNIKLLMSFLFNIIKYH